jgi:DNA-binding PadR family transcriptional regulator
MFPGAGFGFGWARGAARGWARGRRFEKGDLKYVILDLLKERPRHGYDIIRALEERSAGFYTPSPGAVYPTLQMLEDLGYVTALERDGKKVYTITEEGRRFLEERGDVWDDISSRMSGWWDPAFRKEMHEMMSELKDLGRVFGRGGRHGFVHHEHHGRHGPGHHHWGFTPEKLRRIREVIARARREIEAILAEESPRDSSPGSSYT